MSRVARTLPALVLAVVLGGALVLLSSSCGCPPPGEARTPLVSGAAALPPGLALSVPWGPGERYRVIRGYGRASHTGVARPNRSNDHYALDFDLRAGDPVRAVAGGVVAYAGAASGGWATFGEIVLVHHAGGVSSLYAHLAAVEVRRGQRVSAGGRLGTAGDSGGGRAHLHLSLYRDVRLADGPGGVGPYGGRAVLPEPLGGRVGLARGQCLEALDAGASLVPELRKLPRAPA